MEMVFQIEKDDYDRAGMASSKIKKTLAQLGLDNGVIRRVAVAAYEAEINLVIHSDGGTMAVEIMPDKIEIDVEDQGPGIADVNKAMEEGFSTASVVAIEMGFGAGMGLPNMKKCADEFQIQSALGVGTKIEMKFNFAGGR